MSFPVVVRRFGGRFALSELVRRNLEDLQMIGVVDVADQEQREIWTNLDRILLVLGHWKEIEPVVWVRLRLHFCSAISNSSPLFPISWALRMSAMLSQLGRQMAPPLALFRQS